MATALETTKSGAAGIAVGVVVAVGLAVGVAEGAGVSVAGSGVSVGAGTVAVAVGKAGVSVGAARVSVALGVVIATGLGAVVRVGGGNGSGELVQAVSDRTKSARTIARVLFGILAAWLIKPFPASIGYETTAGPALAAGAPGLG